MSEFKVACTDVLSSEAQFEYQLKKWGFQKYLKKDDWKSISWEIARRKAVGKDSEVLFNNKLIPNANVHRQIVRNGFANVFNQRARGAFFLEHP